MARRRAHPRRLCTAEQRKTLPELQQARCVICGRDDAELHVDHSHRTGRVRGLLCRTCSMISDLRLCIGLLPSGPTAIMPAWRGTDAQRHATDSRSGRGA
jgi:Recombination endonuclease VII